jgi:hypothetical protein
MLQNSFSSSPIIKYMQYINNRLLMWKSYHSSALFNYWNIVGFFFHS